MLSQGHMGAALFHYTGQVAPRFGDSDSLEERKWCHKVIVEADIHLRLLYTAILDIYKVFEPLVCCLWEYGRTLIPWHQQSCPQIWGFRFTWGVKIMPQHHGWGWYSSQTISYIHIRHIKRKIDKSKRYHWVFWWALKIQPDRLYC